MFFNSSAMSGSVLAARRMISKTGSDPLEDACHILGEQLNLAVGVLFLEHHLRAGSLEQGGGLIIAAHGYLDQLHQDRPFIAENRVDRLRRYPRFLSNGFNGCTGIPAFLE